MKLVKRSNGYYYIYYDRVHKTSLKTKDDIEARKLFNLKKETILQGKIVELDKVKNIKLSHFKEDYLKTREINVKPETRDNDELSFRKLIDMLGDMALRQVDRKAIDEFKSKCLSFKLSKSYINIMLRSLRGAFNAALDAGYISSNPFLQRRGKPSILFKIDEEIPRFLNEREIEALFKVIGDPNFSLLVKFLLYTGLRRSELVRLNVKDVDLINGVLYVRGTKGKRDMPVPIHDDLKPVLKEIIRHDVGPLFPRWRNKDSLSRLFKKYARLAGLGDRKLHDLRHTFGSYLAIAGEDIKRIKELMRHRDIKTTEIYAKLTTERLKEAVNKLKFADNLKSKGL
jgi:integrase